MRCRNAWIPAGLSVLYLTGDHTSRLIRFHDTIREAQAVNREMLLRLMIDKKFVRHEAGLSQDDAQLINKLAQALGPSLVLVLLTPGELFYLMAYVGNSTPREPNLMADSSG